jgi:hypothetical protein
MARSDLSAQSISTVIEELKRAIADFENGLHKNSSRAEAGSCYAIANGHFRSPHLVAIFPVMTHSNSYKDGLGRGGVLALQAAHG